MLTVLLENIDLRFFEMPKSVAAKAVGAPTPLNS